MKKFFYRVKNGDTVCSIARFFNFSVGEIISQNSLSAEVEEGDLLVIKSSIEKGDDLYCVKPFDTASAIAERFNKTEKELLEQNGVEYVFYGLTIKI